MSFRLERLESDGRIVVTHVSPGAGKDDQRIRCVSAQTCVKTARAVI